MYGTRSIVAMETFRNSIESGGECARAMAGAGRCITSTYEEHCEQLEGAVRGLFVHRGEVWIERKN